MALLGQDFMLVVVADELVATIRVSRVLDVALRAGPRERLHLPLPSAAPGGQLPRKRMKPGRVSRRVGQGETASVVQCLRVDGREDEDEDVERGL